MYIPLVDCDQEKRGAEVIAAEIDSALRTSGFMAVSGLGLAPEEIDAILRTAQSYFAQDLATKQRCAYGSAYENFGYQGVGVESLDPARPPDLKETFTMRNLRSTRLEPGRWPDEAFRTAASRFYATAFDAALNLQRLLARALGMPENFFVDCHSGENVTLRLLHYPPFAHQTVEASQMGAGAHTDYGLLTLLMQDAVGGLQVRDEGGVWHDVPPRPGTVLINSGDLLERWSNGRYRSTCHRVLPRGAGQDRYSVALFVDPDSATEVVALPSCVDAQHPARFAPTTAGRHLTERIQATHRG